MRFPRLGRVHWAVLLAVGLGVAEGGIALASAADSGGLIHACYDKQSGQVRIFDPGGPIKGCGKTENETSWPRQGLRLWAVVGFDVINNQYVPALLSGTASSVERLNPTTSGEFLVRFAGHDLVRCAALVTPIDTSAAPTAFAAAFLGYEDAVYVRFSAPNFIDSSFSLLVAC